MVCFTLFTLAVAIVGAVAVPLDGTLRLPRRAATVYSSCTVPNTVALTFDDGPYIYTKEVVDQLDKAGAKGTFFFNGKNWDCIYNAGPMDSVKYAYSHGHMIGSHTWSHKDLATLTPEEIDDEMSRLEQAVQRITGALVGFMRPPYGSYNQQVLEVSGNRSQGVVIWDFDSQDSGGATPEQSQNLYNDKANQHPSTILALNHDTRNTTVREVLPYAISRLQGAGYKLVTVAECLGMPAYQSVGLPAEGTWTC